jgi:tetratricopeptide (TPR) repeat protein
VRGLRVLLGALLVAGLAAAAVGASAAVADSPDDAAIAFYRERMARDPGDHLTPVSLGAVYLRKARASGDLAFAARAGEAAERSLALQSDHAPALVLLAAIRSAEHRFPEALALAERALARDPTSPDGWAVLADARLNVGDLAAARTAIAALDARVSGVQSLGRLALWRAATGDDEGAIAEWTGALVAGEAQGAGPADLAWAHLERGGLHHSRGRLAAAEADYLRARELDPEGWRAEARLAGLRGTQQRWDEAIERYERLAARAPRPEIWHALGDLHRFVGRPKDAAPWLDRAEAGYREVADRGGASTYHHLAAFGRGHRLGTEGPGAPPDERDLRRARLGAAPERRCRRGQGLHRARARDGREGAASAHARRGDPRARRRARAFGAVAPRGAPAESAAPRVPRAPLSRVAGDA